VEVNAGPGQLTRSLLAGGQKEVVKPWSAEEIDASRDAWKGVTMPKLDSPARGSGTKLPEGFPLWRNELSEGRTLDKHDEEDKAAEHREGAVTTETASAAETASASAINKPALVVASESSAQIIMRGLGFPAELVPFKGLMLERLSEAAILDDMTSAGVYQSPLDPRLALSLSTPYRWPVLPRILSSPIVAKHLPIYDPEAPPGPDTTKRPWEADPPPLTIVGHIPNSLNGEQMLAQWVGSSVGEAGTPRSWIWEWGRVRLALLVGKSLYDVSPFRIHFRKDTDSDATRREGGEIVPVPISIHYQPLIMPTADDGSTGRDYPLQALRPDRWIIRRPSSSTVPPCPQRRQIFHPDRDRRPCSLEALART
jgi:hypothetical protein